MGVLRIVANMPARDPASLAVWYRDILGLDVAMDHGFIVTLTAGREQGAQLSLASQGGAGTDLPAISVEVDDLDQIIARAAGSICYGPTVENWGVRRIYLRDPEGNLINILQHS